MVQCEMYHIPYFCNHRPLTYHCILTLTGISLLIPYSSTVKIVAVGQPVSKQYPPVTPTVPGLVNSVFAG
jgi:hypothetical protein